MTNIASGTAKRATASFGSLYDRHYYDTYGDKGYSWEVWGGLFTDTANQIVARLSPRRALDIGCAKGFLVGCLRDRGVDAYGVDISEYAISQVRPEIKPYCRVASATEPISEYYDLITCFEVCEHLAANDAAEAIRQMTSHTQTILFSSTPGHFEEPTHFSVYPIIDWLRLFAGCSFSPDSGFDCGFLAPQAMLLRRSAVPLPDRELCRFAHQRNVSIAASELGYARLQNDYRDVLGREAYIRAHPASGVREASRILWDCVKNSAKARLFGRRGLPASDGEEKSDFGRGIR